MKQTQYGFRDQGGVKERIITNSNFPPCAAGAVKQRRIWFSGKVLVPTITLKQNTLVTFVSLNSHYRTHGNICILSFSPHIHTNNLQMTCKTLQKGRKTKTMSEGGKVEYMILLYTVFIYYYR